MKKLDAIRSIGYIKGVLEQCKYDGLNKEQTALRLKRIIDEAIRLAENNVQAINARKVMNSNNPRLNGFACPKCGEELFDSKPMITLTSMPPKKNVHCSKCDYVGYRVV
jgi:hypothetical protein